jgi:hypothetical protein
MRQKLPLALSLAALVVAALGWTSIGGTASSVQAKGGSVPLGAAVAAKVSKAVLHTSGLRAKAVRARPRRGPRGFRGPRGPAGPAGAAGATNVTTAQFAYTVSGSSAAWAWQACAAGQKATGGGVRSDNPSINLYESYPVNSAGNPLAPNEIPTAWKVGVDNFSSGTLPFTVYVICAAP